MRWKSFRSLTLNKKPAVQKTPSVMPQNRPSVKPRTQLATKPAATNLPQDRILVKMLPLVVAAMSDAAVKCRISRKSNKPAVVVRTSVAAVRSPSPKPSTAAMACVNARSRLFAVRVNVKRRGCVPLMQGQRSNRCVRLLSLTPSPYRNFQTVWLNVPQT